MPILPTGAQVDIKVGRNVGTDYVQDTVDPVEGGSVDVFDIPMCGDLEQPLCPTIYATLDRRHHLGDFKHLYIQQRQVLLVRKPECDTVEGTFATRRSCMYCNAWLLYCLSIVSHVRWKRS